MRCPRCLKEYPRLLAVSRADNKTHICDNCGVAEALEDYLRNGRRQGKMVTLDALRQRIVDYYGTVRYFAEAMGFSESTLSLMLNGKRKILPDWRRMMGEALDIGESDFLKYFGGSDKEFYVIDCGDRQYGAYDTLIEALQVFQDEKDGIRVLKRIQLDEVMYRRKK